MYVQELNSKEFPRGLAVALGCWCKNRTSALLHYVKTVNSKVLSPIEFPMEHFFLYVRTVIFPPI